MQNRTINQNNRICQKFEFIAKLINPYKIYLILKIYKLKFYRQNLYLNLNNLAKDILMIHQHNSDEENFHSFTKESLWRQLTLIFQKYQSDLASIGICKDYEKNQSKTKDQQIGLVSSQIRNLSQRLQKQIKIKLANILFSTSVNVSTMSKMRNQVEQTTKTKDEQNNRHKQEMNNMIKKMTDLQTLVKIYEKSLINSRMKIPILSKEQNFSSLNSVIMKQRRELSIEIFKITRSFDIKLQPSLENAHSIQMNNLSYSRLTSSRMNSSNLNTAPLREMEHNWNKSVNVSSKSIYSGNKQKDGSVRKDDKVFIKSNAKQNQLTKSYAKQSASKICSINNKQNTLIESTISEFSINKN